MSLSKTTIEVSVVLITYNQEKFIKDALDSILMQKTSFKIEILIGEDCSTDNTAEIIKEYQRKFRDRLTIVYNSVNIGASKNLYNLLSLAKGKYIAMLEGDDYWLDERRLQVLYDFMENNNYAAVSHQRERRTENGELVGYDPDDNLLSHDIDLTDYHDGKSFSVMGCMYRNYFRNSSALYEKSMTMARNACDNVIAHVILSHGKVYIMNKCFGVYRVLHGTENCSYCANTKQDKVDLDAIKQYRGILNFLTEDSYFKKEIAYRSFDAILFLLKRKKYRDIIFFWNELSIKEKIWFYIYLLRNILGRVNLHLRRNK